MAARAGLSKAHLWELEVGRALNPAVATLDALARELRLPAAHLFNAALTSRRILLDPKLGEGSPL